MIKIGIFIQGDISEERQLLADRYARFVELFYRYYGIESEVRGFIAPGSQQASPPVYMKQDIKKALVGSNFSPDYYHAVGGSNGNFSGQGDSPGHYSVSYPGRPSYPWILVHEISHNFGLQHAKRQQSSGNILEYGDDTSVMGNDLAGFNGPNAARLGLINEVALEDDGVYPTKGVVYRTDTLLISQRGNDKYSRKGDGISLHRQLSNRATVLLHTIKKGDTFNIDELTITNYGHSIGVSSDGTIVEDTITPVLPVWGDRDPGVYLVNGIEKLYVFSKKTAVWIWADGINTRMTSIFNDTAYWVDKSLKTQSAPATVSTEGLEMWGNTFRIEKIGNSVPRLYGGGEESGRWLVEYEGKVITGTPIFNPYVSDAQDILYIEDGISMAPVVYGQLEIGTSLVGNASTIVTNREAKFIVGNKVEVMSRLA